MKILITSFIAFLGALSAQAAELGPQPGDVYREFQVHARGNKGWRVTDPNAKDKRAHAFLPNPVLQIEVSDLKDAIRAEAVLERWGGHPNTADKRVRFNGNEWIVVPELATTPPNTQPETFLSQDNPVIEVPLSQIKEGTNTVEGTCGVINNSKWGQWGMYSLNLRVYYDPAKKAHAAAEIISPADGSTITDNPQITIKAADDAAIKRIDFVGHYYDYDFDGDGVYEEWVESWNQPANDEPAVINHHIGTLTQAPFELVWDTEWVPDQEPGRISLAARVQDAAGVWSVTDAATSLTLERKKTSVRLASATYVPPRFMVRAGATRVAVIPLSESSSLSTATAAKILLRTWNGFDEAHEPFQFNDWSSPVGGKNHFYAYSEHDVPLTALRKIDNIVSFSSKTAEHAEEISWPGPAMKIRLDLTKVKPKAASAASKPAKKAKRPTTKSVE